MIERLLLAIIAASTTAIAAKLWTTPEPTSAAVMVRLSEMEDKPGADVEAIRRMKAEALQRTPWVWIRNP